jgi:hypothetical protein
MVYLNILYSMFKYIIGRGKEEMKLGYFTGIIFFYVLLTISISVPFFMLDYYYSGWKCSQRAIIMNKEFKYQYLTGCYIKHNGEFILINNYRVID